MLDYLHCIASFFLKINYFDLLSENIKKMHYFTCENVQIYKNELKFAPLWPCLGHWHCLSSSSGNVSCRNYLEYVLCSTISCYG